MDCCASLAVTKNASWRAQRGHPSWRYAVMDCRASLAVTGKYTLAVTGKYLLAVTGKYSLAVTKKSAASDSENLETR